jgi:hypothetical protein
MIKDMRASFVAYTILLASMTALFATSGVAAAHSRDHGHKDHKVHKDHGDGHSDHARSHHRRKHDKHKVVCIKAPCPGDRDDGHDKHRHKQADDRKRRPDNDGKSKTDASKITVGVSNGVTATRIENGTKGLYAVIRSPGTVTITNGKDSVTLRGNSVNITGAAVKLAPVECTGCVLKSIPAGGYTIVADPKKGYYPAANPSRGISGPRQEYPMTPASAPAPAPAAVSHVTGGPEGGFFGALGSSIVDAGKAVGRGAESAISVGSPKPGTPGAGAPKTSTTTQQ